MLILLTRRVSKNTFLGLVFLPEANLEGRGVAGVITNSSSKTLKQETEVVCIAQDKEGTMDQEKEKLLAGVINRSYDSYLTVVCIDIDKEKTIGQTFCDLHTHLHLFYRIFHSIKINNFDFFLVYSVILGIF